MPTVYRGECLTPGTVDVGVADFVDALGRAKNHIEGVEAQESFLRLLAMALLELKDAPADAGTPPPA